VVDLPYIRKGEPVPVGGMTFKAAAEERMIAEARLAIEALGAELKIKAANAGLAARAVELEGEPVDVMSGLLQTHDVVVVGRHGSFHEVDDRNSTLVMGLLKHGPRPVWLAPENASAKGPILIAYDGSTPSARAMHLFTLMGLAAMGKVVVMTIGETLSEARKTAARGVDFLSAHGVAAETLAISAEDPSAAIIDAVAAHHPSLLVMGAYGHTGLKQWFFGSTTAKLIDNCAAPVFIHH
jgi:nucleotide-binding universal stress UspA family protein